MADYKIAVVVDMVLFLLNVYSTEQNCKSNNSTKSIHLNADIK